MRCFTDKFQSSIKQLFRIYFSIIGNIVMPLKLSMCFMFSWLKYSEPETTCPCNREISMFNDVHVFRNYCDRFIQRRLARLYKLSKNIMNTGRLNLFLVSLSRETLLPKLWCSLKFCWLLFPCRIQYLVLYSYHTHSGSQCQYFLGHR